MYVGRRDARVDVYDLRAARCRTVSLPRASGPLSSIICLPQQQQQQQQRVLLASSDTVRLWDPLRNTFSIISELQAGATSLVADARGSYLFTASGGKGWVEKGPQEVGCFEVISR